MRGGFFLSAEEYRDGRWNDRVTREQKKTQLRKLE